MTPASIRRLARIVAAIVLVLLLARAARSIDVARLLLELRNIRRPWVLGALCGYLALLPLWALQWRLLAAPVAGNTYRRMLGVSR